LAVVRHREGGVRAVLPGLRAGDCRVDGHALKLADALKLVLHDAALDLKLALVGDVLEAAAAAQPRPEVRAGRLDTVGRGLDDLDDARMGKAALVLNDDRKAHV